MNEIDWSKAPEGATHYAAARYPWKASWYIVSEPYISTMLDDGEDDEWDMRRIDDEDRAGLLPRLVARHAPTAEDAEAIRATVVDAMVKACPYPGSTSTRLDCAALYDAGYRKP